MKVKCIDNYRCEATLAIGNFYEVIKIDRGNIYIIINDYGEKDWYRKDRFKTLSEYRIEMINKLLRL